jgi:thiol-disulfide isomerase/thioredoxin
MHAPDNVRRGFARRPRLTRLLLLAGFAVALAWIALPGALRFGRDPTPAMLDALPIAMLNGAPTGLVGRAAGRPLVVNLWATWCPPCRHEMPLLADAQRRPRRRVRIREPGRGCGGQRSATSPTAASRSTT